MPLEFIWRSEEGLTESFPWAKKLAIGIERVEVCRVSKKILLRCVIDARKARSDSSKLFSETNRDTKINQKTYRLYEIQDLCVGVVVEGRRDVVESQVEVEGKKFFSEEGREVEKKYSSLALELVRRC